MDCRPSGGTSIKDVYKKVIHSTPKFPAISLECKACTETTPTPTLALALALTRTRTLTLTRTLPEL